MKTPKIRLVVEISQERYLQDEDYVELDVKELTDRQELARLLDSGYYDVTINPCWLSEPQ